MNSLTILNIKKTFWTDGRDRIPLTGVLILDASIINIYAEIISDTPSDYKTCLQINTMSVYCTIMSWPQRVHKIFQQYTYLLNFTDFIILPH